MNQCGARHRYQSQLLYSNCPLCYSSQIRNSVATSPSLQARDLAVVSVKLTEPAVSGATHSHQIKIQFQLDHACITFQPLIPASLG